MAHYNMSDHIDLGGTMNEEEFYDDFWSRMLVDVKIKDEAEAHVMNHSWNYYQSLMGGSGTAFMNALADAGASIDQGGRVQR